MTSITQNPVKFYKYSTKTQYTSDSSNRDSTNGVAFVADEKAIYQGGVKYGADGYTGSATIGNVVFNISNGLITSIITTSSQDVTLASSGTEATSTQNTFKVINLQNCQEIFNPDTTNYDYILRYIPSTANITSPQLGLTFDGGGSLTVPASETIINFEHILTSSELAQIAALSSDPSPSIVLYYSSSSSDRAFLDANMRAYFTADSIRLVKRPKS